MTATSLVALLEAKATLDKDSGESPLVPEEALEKAVECVRKNKTEELYAKALSTYALR